MTDFHIILLREKITLSGLDAGSGNAPPVITLGNRVECALADEASGAREHYVVRGQTMHLTLRMVTRIMASFLKMGPLLSRPVPFAWDAAWQHITHEYEAIYNPQRAVTVYNRGHVLYHAGVAPHPFIDAIENAAAHGAKSYEEAVRQAEQEWRKNHPALTVLHESTIALTATLGRTQGRCGLVIRAGGRSTIFSFSINARDKQKLDPSQVLSGCAAFLEGIQIAFMVGMDEGQQKIAQKIHGIQPDAAAQKMLREARRRMNLMAAEIASLESTFQIRYRPERLVFTDIAAEAERMALKKQTRA